MRTSLSPLSLDGPQQQGRRRRQEWGRSVAYCTITGMLGVTIGAGRGLDDFPRARCFGMCHRAPEVSPELEGRFPLIELYDERLMWCLSRAVDERAVDERRRWPETWQDWVPNGQTKS